MDLKKIGIGFIGLRNYPFGMYRIVTFLWGLIFHGVAMSDWETSFRFCNTFGIIFLIWIQRKNEILEVIRSFEELKQQETLTTGFLLCWKRQLLPD